MSTIPSKEALCYIEGRLQNDWRIDAQCAVENPQSQIVHLSNARKSKEIADWLGQIISEIQDPSKDDPTEDDIPF